MCVKYPHHGQLRLLFTDRDSLSYAVQTEDIYRDMAEDAATYYDFSEYPLEHPLYSAMNRKVLRFLKDELNSVPMLQFVGPRPKCYAFLCTGKVSNNVFQDTNLVEKKTAKCVKRYLDALNNFHTYLCRQNLIKSTLHCAHSSHVQGRLVNMIQNGGCVTIPFTLMHMVTGVYCCSPILTLSIYPLCTYHSLYIFTNRH